MKIESYSQTIKRPSIRIVSMMRDTHINKLNNSRTITNSRTILANSRANSRTILANSRTILANMTAYIYSRVNNSTK